MICSIVSRSGGIAMIGINNSRSRRAGAAMIYSSRHCLIASFASSSATSSNNNNNDKTKNNIEIDTPQKTPPTTTPVRRRLRSSSSNTSEPIPSLADFIHRAKVMKQYRKFVRLAHYVDGKDGTTTGGSSAGYRAALDEVRLSYKMKMTKQLDTISKTMALTEGERKMKEISTMVGYIPVHRSSDQQQTTNNESKTENSSSFDADSWINIQDDEDKRGRMGVQWPWQKKEEDDEGERSK